MFSSPTLPRCALTNAGDLISVRAIQKGFDPTLVPIPSHLELRPTPSALFVPESQE